MIRAELFVCISDFDTNLWEAACQDYLPEYSFSAFTVRINALQSFSLKIEFVLILYVFRL